MTKISNNISTMTRWLTGGGAVPIFDNCLKLETNDFLLLENGFKLLLE